MIRQQSSERVSLPVQRVRSTTGEPMVWLTAMGLTIGLVMVVYLIGLIVVNGLTAFWPTRVAQIELQVGSKVGINTSRISIASSRTAMPRMTPISFGGSGPERAKVKKTATITAAAAKITGPEWARPPIEASRGSPVRS